MTTASPRRGSVHVAVARALVVWFNRKLPADLREDGQEDVQRWLDPHARAIDRIEYLRILQGGWLGLGLIVGFAMVPLGWLGQQLGGAAVRNAIAVACLTGSLFCTPGVFVGFYCVLWAYAARRRERRFGAHGDRVATAMRHTLPTNRSLIFQAIIAACTFAIATS
jgi:hypothetical protein